MPNNKGEKYLNLIKEVTMSAADLLRRPNRVNRLALRREGESPMLAIQNEMYRMFEQFFSEDFPFSNRLATRPGLDFFPKMDISESETEYKVSAELPGMDEKDISVELQDDVLVLRGEKKNEQEEKGKNWFRREQSYGSFHRAIELPAGVDAGKAKAQFKKGVLTFVAPKRPEEQARRKTVPIQAE